MSTPRARPAGGRRGGKSRAVVQRRPYLLRDGQISVADAQNCRVLVINVDHSVASQIGTDGACVPFPPVSMGSPNGDPPLWDGNLPISENQQFVGQLSLSTPPADTWSGPCSFLSPTRPILSSWAPPRTVNSDHYLIADYSDPGEVLQFDRQGQVLSKSEVAAGPGMLNHPSLNHPSLADGLPNGMYMINDDYNDLYGRYRSVQRGPGVAVRAHRAARNRSGRVDDTERFRPPRSGRHYSHASPDRLDRFIVWAARLRARRGVPRARRRHAQPAVNRAERSLPSSEAEVLDHVHGGSGAPEGPIAHQSCQSRRRAGRGGQDGAGGGDEEGAVGEALPIGGPVGP